MRCNGVAGHRDARQDGRDDDDVAPLGRVGEAGLRRANALVGADQVRRDEVVEAVVGARLVRAADAAVRDERVDRAVRLGGSGECELDLRRVADVALRDEPAADLLDSRVQCVGAARQGAQAGALEREAQRDRLSDAAARSRDDDVAPLESLHRHEPSQSRAGRLLPAHQSFPHGHRGRPRCLARRTVGRHRRKDGHVRFGLRARSSAGEHSLHTRGVAGSIPAAPTELGVAQTSGVTMR